MHPEDLCPVCQGEVRNHRFSEHHLARDGQPYLRTLCGGDFAFDGTRPMKVP
jgi:hypothetical protein